jgi:hypothetical protein
VLALRRVIINLVRERSVRFHDAHSIQHEVVVPVSGVMQVAALGLAHFRRAGLERG